MGVTREIIRHADGGHAYVMPLGTRLGRHPKSRSLELNENIEEYMDFLSKKTDENSKMKLSIIRTIQKNAELGRPLSAVDLIATFAVHHNSVEKETLVPYVKNYNYLRKKMKFLDNERPITSGPVLMPLLKELEKNLPVKILKVLDSSLGSVSTNEFVDRFVIDEGMRKTGFRYALGILERAELAVKMPRQSSIKGSPNRWLRKKLRNSRASIPNYNANFVLMRLLAKSSEGVPRNELIYNPTLKKTLGIAKNRKARREDITRLAKPYIKEGHIIRISKTGKEEESSLLKPVRGIVYKLSPETKKLVEKTEKHGVLDEELRQILLGKPAKKQAEK